MARLFADYPLKVAIVYPRPRAFAPGAGLIANALWRSNPWTVAVQEWCAVNCKHEWMMALGLRGNEARFGFDDARDAALFKMIYSGYRPDIE